MGKRYHVAHESFGDWEDLLCYAELEARGIAPEYKWDDYIDTDVVCMFSTLAEARSFRDEWLDSGKIVEIDIPDDDFCGWGLTLVTVGEGYEAIVGSIPNKFLKVIS